MVRTLYRRLYRMARAISYARRGTRYPRETVKACFRLAKHASPAVAQELFDRGVRTAGILKIAIQHGGFHRKAVNGVIAMLEDYAIFPYKKKSPTRTAAILNKPLQTLKGAEKITRDLIDWKWKWLAEVEDRLGIIFSVKAVQRLFDNKRFSGSN